MGHRFRDTKDLHRVRSKASHCPAGDFTWGQKKGWVRSTPVHRWEGEAGAPGPGTCRILEGITGASSHQAGHDKEGIGRAGRGPEDVSGLSEPQWRAGERVTTSSGVG